MTTHVHTVAHRAGARQRGDVRSLSGLGAVTLWLSILVLIPLAAVAVTATQEGVGAFWDAAFSRQARSALWFTLWISLAVTAVDAVLGTLTAWVLERDRFPGRRLLDTLIDLPFALPTVVAGITILALYGQSVAYTRWAVVLALAFVTLPFVIRSVQPVIRELDTEMEEAAASLGARPATTFRRVVLPCLRPAIISGSALAFARAIGEFGSVALISGNIPFDTQVSSVYAFKQLESDNVHGAAAVSIVMLAIALMVLLALRTFERRGGLAGRARP